MCGGAKELAQPLGSSYYPYMPEKLRKIIENTLATRMSGRAQGWQHSEAYPHYCRAPELNLLDGVKLEDFEEDFRAGAGNELEPDGDKPPKFCALISSSALAANCFGPFRRDPSSLTISGDSGFDELRFEAQCPTGLKGTPPTLDVLLSAGDRVLAIESKFTEYLTRKPAKFADAYNGLLDTLFEPQWAAVYEELKTDPMAYAPLDAAQLVKHYLGIRNTFPDKETTLLYLYWEPMDNPTGGVFEAHRNSVDRLTERTAGSIIGFESISYPQLWKAWAECESQALRSQADHLLNRYGLSL